jgi:hypothetical protein
MRRTPAAVRAAQRLIVWERGVLIADRDLTFELATEPDQYRILYPRRRWRRGRLSHSQVLTITITPADFQHWQHWHAASLARRGRKNKGARA